MAQMTTPRRPPRPLPHLPLLPNGTTMPVTGVVGGGDTLPPAGPCLRINPAACTTACIATASTTLVACLTLTQYYPGRFHIHPLPYVSDAGLRDPERILLGAGLSLSGALFIPLSIAVRLHQRSLLSSLPPLIPIGGGRGGRRIPVAIVATAIELAGRAGWGVFLFLVATASVPGRWLAHHAVAASFALCGAVWGGCSVGTLWLTSGGRVAPRPDGVGGTGGGPGAAIGSRARRVTVAAWLSALLCTIIVVFVAVWVTVRLDMPPKIKNKDKRFVAMAILEYIGTGCFLSILGVLAAEVRGRVLIVSLGDATEGRSG